MPTSSDRTLFRWLPKGLAGLAGVACAACCLIPVLLAAWAKRHRSGVVVARAVGSVMVPLMALTLLVVVASQVPQLGGSFGVVAQAVPFYIAFLLVMALSGWVVAGCSGSTRSAVGP